MSNRSGFYTIHHTTLLVEGFICPGFQSHRCILVIDSIPQPHSMAPIFSTVARVSDKKETQGTLTFYEEERSIRDKNLIFRPFVGLRPPG
jgi:hypothetical protein